MAYNPEKHHRRSIRLKGHDYSASGVYFITICTYQREGLFGEVLAGEMQLNRFGRMVRSHWLNLPKYHCHLRLDEFVVMPNHIHGILTLIDDSAKDSYNPALVVGPDFNDYIMDSTDTLVVGVDLDNHSLGHRDALVVGAGFDNHALGYTDALLAKPAPTPSVNSMVNHSTINKTGHPRRYGIPEIVRGFKTFSARRINQMRKSKGIPVWQRNYYEHIVQDVVSLQHIRHYIFNNPLSWQKDQLHPDNPSKW